jgi:hypothetical protein
MGRRLSSINSSASKLIYLYLDWSGFCVILERFRMSKNPRSNEPASTTFGPMASGARFFGTRYAIAANAIREVRPINKGAVHCGSNTLKDFRLLNYGINT